MLTSFESTVSRVLARRTSLICPRVAALSGCEAALLPAACTLPHTLRTPHAMAARSGSRVCCFYGRTVRTMRCRYSSCPWCCKSYMLSSKATVRLVRHDAEGTAMIFTEYSTSRRRLRRRPHCYVNDNGDDDDDESGSGSSSEEDGNCLCSILEIGEQPEVSCSALCPWRDCLLLTKSRQFS